MRFLIDAQLPRRMCQWLAAAGCDAVHTLDLPTGNSTPDSGVTDAVDSDGRVVVTKDADFVDSHLLLGRPAKLFLISTGNIANDELRDLIMPLLGDMLREFQTCRFIELSRTGLVVRG